MKLTTILFVFLLMPLFLIVQDGSDIIYIKPKELNSSHVGKKCHIDFGRKSFRGIVIDTLKVKIRNQQIVLVEHRKDNGFNNWFREQYLETVASHKAPSIRLYDSRIDSITSEKIYVSSTLGYYSGNSPLDTITIIQHSYLRKDIAEILFKHNN